MEVLRFRTDKIFFASVISPRTKITRLGIFHSLSLKVVRFDKVNSDSDSPSNSLQLCINTSSTILVSWKKSQEQQRHLHHSIPLKRACCYISSICFNLSSFYFRTKSAIWTAVITLSPYAVAATISWYLIINLC